MRVSVLVGMAAGEGRRVGQKRSQPGGKPGPTGPKRRKASKQAHSPEALAKKVYHAKKALVRASQKWKAKNVASTKRRLKQAAVAHAALVAKGEEGQAVPAKALANVRKKLAAATADTGLMKVRPLLGLPFAHPASLTSCRSWTWSCSGPAGCSRLQVALIARSSSPLLTWNAVRRLRHPPTTLQRRGAKSSSSRSSSVQLVSKSP